MDTNGVNITNRQLIADDDRVILLRRAVGKVINEALELEVDDFLSRHAGLLDSRGRQRVVRNGYLGTRKLSTPFGEVNFAVPRIRDRQSGTQVERVTYQSNILPPWKRLSRYCARISALTGTNGSNSKLAEILIAILGNDNVSRMQPYMVQLEETWNQALPEMHCRSSS